MTLLLALVCGLIFGLGLVMSGMIDPAKVQGFLNIVGPWDPRLGIVLFSAVTTAYFGFQLLFECHRPILAKQFLWPQKRQVDTPLILGSLIFGAGWGLFGYCPGTALTALALGQPQTAIFILAIIAGMGLQKLTTVKHPPATSMHNDPSGKRRTLDQRSKIHERAVPYSRNA
jgi:hypothetical protein|tara:strand:- start:16781 stop:17296 length:516 start_codon:yes stop_codon:yes gene_type:complete